MHFCHHCTCHTSRQSDSILRNLIGLKVYGEECEVCHYEFFAILLLLPLCEILVFVLHFILTHQLY
jgi:hypothetical protein